MRHTDQALLVVLRAAQGLGLVAPFRFGLWDNWWAQTSFSRPIPVIRVSLDLNSAPGRKKIENLLDMGDRPNGGRSIRGWGVAEAVIAHEVGHAFEDYWQRRPPLAGYRRQFRYFSRFAEPWSDLCRLRREEPEQEYDRDLYVSWYAWSDCGEDFAETFAEVLRVQGRIECFRARSGVYGKARTILNAGRVILRQNHLLRACNRHGFHYVSGGHRTYTCRPARRTFGVPLIDDSYVCPCGGEIEVIERRIHHSPNGGPG